MRIYCPFSDFCVGLPNLALVCQFERKNLNPCVALSIPGLAIKTIGLMDILEATFQYEKWMAAHMRVVKADLPYKHEQMRESSFAFLRATFYRWIQLWKEFCTTEASAPAVLAVGDLHIENFGTWRDGEGRLIWGINDFDEAFPLPYTFDLIRLGTSARLAIESEHLTISTRDACDAILEGYTDAIRAGGRPFVLDEEHVGLRQIALGELRDPVRFWAKMRKLPDFAQNPSTDLTTALELLLPKNEVSYRIKRRRAGLGSLGRPRLVALADWGGGPIAREAKAALPSACCSWDKGPADTRRIRYSEIIEKAVRVPDPFVKLCGNWIVRRLAPDCSKIELDSLPRKRDEARILRAMGFETANVHLGSEPAVKNIRLDLGRRPAQWFYKASKKMVKAVESDWQLWRKRAAL
jgi:hypothetical protein